MKMKRLIAVAAAILALASCAELIVPADPQAAFPPSTHPELIVVNAKVVTADERFSIHQAFAVRDGKFLAIGSNEEVRALAGRRTRVMDAGGRTVLPGLIDSHIHMLRAGFTWKHEVRVDEAQTLQDIIGAVKARAARTPRGTWIIVLGGWSHNHIKERRMLTREELDLAAPDHLVYVQSTREIGQLNSAGIRASGITAATKVPPGVLIGKDAKGEFDGSIRGFAGARYAEGMFPKPTLEDKIEGLRLIMRDFNAAGLTSVGEGIGLGVSDDDYQVFFELWRRRLMTVRTGLNFHANDSDQALRWIKHMAAGFSDDWLHFNGMGEIVMLSMWDGFMPVKFDVAPATRADFYKVIEAGARNKVPFQLHSTLESTMNHMLGVIEDVHPQHPVDKLRIAFLHVERITLPVVERMKRLGMGAQMHSRQVLSSDVMVQRWGGQATDVPAVKTVYRSGLPLAGGTDGPVTTSYRPFIAIWWLISGKNWRGDLVRPTEKLTREEALRVYTRNSAWFTFEENRKGAIIPGFLADFIVLDGDYLTVPEDEIRFIKPVMTVVGGRVVYEAK